jgi:kumamolisin
MHSERSPHRSSYRLGSRISTMWSGVKFLPLAFLCLIAARAAIATPRIQLDGSIASVSADRQASGPHQVRAQLTAAETTETLNFIISLRMRGFDDLQSRIAAHQKMSHAELEANYLPASSDYEKVRSWLTQNGFTLTLDDSNHTNIFARGTIARIEAAFNVSFARVATADGEFSSAVTAASLPAEIAGSVLSIAGLQPHLRARHHPRAAAAAAAGTGGQNVAPTPADVAQAYNVPSTMTGVGQTIAIIGDAVPLTSDLTTFWSVCGVSQSLSNFTVVPVNGGAPGSNDTFEATLDVEWASAMAPGAAIRFYAIPDYLYSDITAAATQVLNDLAKYPNLHQLSISISGPENLAGSATVLQSYSQIYAQLAASGVSVFASSGDGGSNPDPDLTNLYSATYPLTPEYPASDPNLTAVGGTAISFDQTWTATGEQAWFTASEPNSAGTVGTGGGQSAIFQRQTWQAGTGMPSGTARCVPDVAAQADGGLVIFGGLQYFVWGTSLATPIWAGITADMNQVRASDGLAPLGLMAAWVYPLIGTSGLTDITTGTNGAYNAGIGYDLCTGAGTPQVGKLTALINTTISQVRAPGGEINAGAPVTMSVTAQILSTYQWYLNGAAIDGATSSSYSIAEAGVTDSGVYTVVISNSVGTSTYSLGTLAVMGPPTILTQPASKTTAAGAATMLHVAVVGAPTLSYQWYFNGTQIPQATSATLTIAETTPENSGSYTVVVSNPGGSVTSADAVLAVQASDSSLITQQPNSLTVATGSTAVFSVGAASASYQWYENGTAIAGATNAALLLKNCTASSTYQCLVSSQTGAIFSSSANLIVTSTSNPGRLQNLSVNASINSSGIAMGFVSGGSGTSGSQNLLIRAVGPTLAEFGITDFLPDPTLSVLSQVNSATVAQNAGWGSSSSQAAAVIAADAATSAFALPDASSLDSALVAALPANGSGYAVNVVGKSGGAGTTLAEVYDDTADYTPASPRLINLSCRQLVPTGGTLTAGFTIGGTTSMTVLIRAMGPTLKNFGLSPTMADPQLVVRALGSDMPVAANAGWAGDAVLNAANQDVFAFSPASPTSLDAEVVITLAPGAYTIQTSSVSGGSGLVQVELYEVQ